MSDRIAVMSRGKPLQIDNSTQLYEAPNCREVAEFIGSMNFFDGSVKSFENGQAQVDVGPLGTWRVPAGSQALQRGARVTIAIRPEKVQIGWERPGGASAIEGQVGAEAYLGDRSHYYVQVAGHSRPIAVANQNMIRSLDNSELRGRAVWLSWPTEAAILLPAE